MSHPGKTYIGHTLTSVLSFYCLFYVVGPFSIEELVAKGKKRFVICSDSPTSQYRNSKNCFLMKRFCIEFGISIRLLFTEAGHGKSPCDGVGGNIKTQVEAVAMNIFGEIQPMMLPGL